MNNPPVGERRNRRTATYKPSPAVGLRVDILETVLWLAIYQALIASVAVAVDLLIVFRAVWLPLMRVLPREDRPYLWAGVAQYAKAAREEAERIARMNDARR